MAALKNSAVHPILSPTSAARGRDNYALYSVLRTKPGRADSPRTSCMSCSDKIAAWNVLGFQGALASSLFPPLYISRTIIGEVPQAMQDTVRGDCARAFWERIGSIQGPFKACSCNHGFNFTNTRPPSNFRDSSTSYSVHLGTLSTLPHVTNAEDIHSHIIVQSVCVSDVTAVLC